MESMFGTTTTPSSPALTHATPAEQRGYIAAMRTLSADREPGVPVRVFISVPPLVAERPTWPKRLKEITRYLPGAEILTYRNALDGTNDYFADWRALVPQLDGLVVIGMKPRPRGFVHRIARVARREVLDLIAAGKPVLLHDLTRKLVPLVDCRRQDIGPREEPALKMTIPSGWNPKADNPTLRAAREALRPASCVARDESRLAQPSQLQLPVGPM